MGKSVMLSFDWDRVDVVEQVIRSERWVDFYLGDKVHVEKYSIFGFRNFGKVSLISLANVGRKLIGLNGLGLFSFWIFRIIWLDWISLIPIPSWWFSCCCWKLANSTQNCDIEDSTWNQNCSLRFSNLIGRSASSNRAVFKFLEKKIRFALIATFICISEISNRTGMIQINVQ